MNIFSSIRKYLCFLMSQESTKTLIITVLYSLISQNDTFFCHFYPPERPNIDNTYWDKAGSLLITHGSRHVHRTFPNVYKERGQQRWREGIPAQCTCHPTLDPCPKLTKVWTERSAFKMFPSYFHLTLEVLTLLEKEKKKKKATMMSIWRFGEGVFSLCIWGKGVLQRKRGKSILMFFIPGNY